ncbi:uncharacterized protein Z519_09737 [Cladophialophora bantiana CBS 173.52]|uniref:Uncharacterized protein n=1 Tax=Cladophialophora bantiana (strain ATCC 10958 / CBS 173.52 / CDC B-1940 / NIH 8579) TaxID=1442370 RepID=A0A0D2EHQ2_CLAB1|nr:uncharacterized protein Z519_09737 [Cladophialophora bantiana CBS 173.52]KIW89581.1 hypothetical protein Z519_09737 [Cladophialophora bantiana CBS 173.52]
MPAYAGFQLALELSNVLPIKDLAASTITTLLNTARDLRNSGSDIVVEADLASIFGRGQVSLELEKAFKAKVHITKITPLHEGSEIELRTGPGPTVTRAFQNPPYFATIVTLSALSYFTRREDLARMIASGMAKRCEANVSGASSPPGYESIENTLAACSTQCGEFHWAPYCAQIERRLRISMQDYNWSADYTRLTPAVLLGAMDFFYIVKSLPVDRIVTISFQTGFIPLTIWAHYILGLNVVITNLSCPDVVFGNADEPHVVIYWRQIDPSDRETPCWNLGTDDEGPEICLHDADMKIILTCKPEDHDSDGIYSRERHPLSGYGTEILRRGLNLNTITRDDDDIYVEAASFIAGFAIVASQRMARELTWPPCEQGQETTEDTGQKIQLEIWRIIDSVKLIFDGITIDSKLCEKYAQLLSEQPPSESTLPSTFNSFFARFAWHGRLYSPADRMMALIELLTKYVLIFAHVFELDKCGDMPIAFSDDISAFSTVLREIREGTDRLGLVERFEVFGGVASVLESSELQDESRNRYAGRLSLQSDFGWCVHLDTYGDRDPAVVRPELVHIRKGTPTNSRTGERKLRIRDGSGFVGGEKSCVCPVERGLTYTPRTFANYTSRKDYHKSLAYEFQITLAIAFQSVPEWQNCGGSKSFKERMRHSEMHENLWNTHLTPKCSHRHRNERKQANIKLGPDAAAVLGFSERHTHDEILPERIIILLTKGDAYVRWLAIWHACADAGDTGRKIMLRGDKCCESCALDYVASQQGKWYLIL